MQACSDLGKLRRAVLARVERIRTIFHQIASSSGYDKRIFTSHVVLELDNLVILALREFTVSSLLNARTAEGGRVRTSRRFNSSEEVGAYILSVINTTKYANLGGPTAVARRDEPTVRDPKETERVLSGCLASNMGSLQRALSLNFGLFSEIASFRNFYAHRNADTFRRAMSVARGWGVVHTAHVDDVVLISRTGRPTTIVEDWLAESEIFFDELRSEFRFTRRRN